MNSFGGRIKSKRKLKGITQTELANIIGCKKSAVSSWENDANTPERKYIEAMAVFFGITAQELQYGTAPVVVNELPAGYELIPTKEYIEFLKFKAEKGEKAEQKLNELKNIENVPK